MEPYRDDDLGAALSALRPTPRPAFAAELDARVAAGFPRSSRLGELSPLAAIDRLRSLKPRQILLPAGGLALTAIVVATAVVSFGDSGSGGRERLSLNSSTGVASGEGARNFDGSGPYTHGAAGLKEVAPASSQPSSAGAEAEGAGATFESETPQTEINRHAGGASAATGATSSPGVAAGHRQRAVERSAAIVLGTEPAQVGDAATEVFDVVHSYRGIVLSSSIADGSADAAAAEFELLIPSGKLGDAMAAFSGIAEVRSRQEASDDITAPTVGAAEHLEDSQARIDGLLAQLAAAETESEREAVEAELRGERGRAAALRAQLQNLERRANLSRVELRIESDEAGAAPGASGSWGVGDALHDAGQILAVAAAVALVGLAIVGPIALIALLVWLANRAWIRRSRRHALN